MKHEAALKQKFLSLCREQLFTFVDRAFRSLNPGQPLTGEFYLRALCHQLERVAAGEVTRLAIAMPPRHLKSQVTSVCFPAWALGQDPGQRIIGASYESSLAEDFSKQCRQVMQSDWYGEVFPKTRLRPDKITKAELGRPATASGSPPPSAAHSRARAATS